MGQTGQSQKTLYGGIAAHSDLPVLKDRTAGVLWERGVSEVTQLATFTRFNHELLEPAGTLVPE